MTLAEQATRHIPEYYDGMYLDGYEPWEIMVANRKRMNRMVAAYYAAQEAKKQADTVDDYEIRIKSEVRVK